MILFLLFLVGIGYVNAGLARRKGVSPVLWGLISVVAFFLSYGILGAIYLSFVYKGPITQDATIAWIEHSPLSILMLILLGFAGVLLVRFILERKQVK